MCYTKKNIFILHSPRNLEYHLDRQSSQISHKLNRIVNKALDFKISALSHKVECLRSIIFITQDTRILKTSGGRQCFVGVIDLLAVYNIMAQHQSFKERRSFSKSHKIDFFV